MCDVNTMLGSHVSHGYLKRDRINHIRANHFSGD